ncbi:putative mitochondrial protein [Nicotiana attenuata]|uniref:Mitochondrial protein n=1 Tax=Nicotiana attenuata TaxID=49451 RepID=A0A314L2S1_NICAT|nr:putative mitochondrial protein [Nicotiana attenuata]
MKPGNKEVNTLLRNEASCLFFFKHSILSRSPLVTGSRLISLPLATKMFQFTKLENSKDRRLATELGYGFLIGDPRITDGTSPWPFASESILPSQCPGIHPMHSFRSCTLCRLAKHTLDKWYTEYQPNLHKKKKENQVHP